MSGIRHETEPTLEALHDEIYPSVATLRRELEQIQEQAQGSVKPMRTASGATRRNTIWSAEEIALLRRNLSQTDKQIANAISATGSRRTPMAIRKKRQEIEAAKHGRRSNGWPVVHGAIEDQSERFRIALLEAMLREVRARQ